MYSLAKNERRIEKLVRKKSGENYNNSSSLLRMNRMLQPIRWLQQKRGWFSVRPWNYLGRDSMAWEGGCGAPPTGRKMFLRRDGMVADGWSGPGSPVNEADHYRRATSLDVT